MRRFTTLWRASAIAFISSFCVMVIELIASRILAPHIGVSLYTWTSIIGVILAGIALGNYLGGKVADRYPSPFVLAAIFLAGGLLTITILPATKMVASIWLGKLGNLPMMLDFTVKTSLIFFLPATVLSMVSPLVIKLTLADLRQTGGIIGTIYAFSTAGAILGTFMTGFYLILWFGTRMIVWLVAAVLLLMGIVTLFSWRIPGRWKLSLKNFIIWTAILEVLLTFIFLFQFREAWQTDYTRESNYYSIRVVTYPRNVKALYLDNFRQSYVVPQEPTTLIYDYLKVFDEIVRYIARENPTPRVLHLGGGGYSFPRYMETVYPESINEVVEIDPAVTQVAHEELGLPLDTSIKTYNQDARLFFLQRRSAEKYDIVIGDVFNDQATPYHLTTLEFNKLVKADMKKEGIYLLNIIDDYERGRFMASLIHTLRQSFNYVHLFAANETWEKVKIDTFVIVATDRHINFADYWKFITEDGQRKAYGNLHDAAKLEEYLSVRKPVLLTDDYVPTDILIAPFFR